MAQKLRIIGRGVLTLMLALMMLGLIMAPRKAWAQAELRTESDGSLTATYTYMSGQDAPQAEPAQIAGGKIYDLQKSTAPLLDETYEPSVKTFTATKVKTLAYSERSKLQDAFPKTYAISEGEYLGSIPRTAKIDQVVAYDKVVRPVSKERDYAGYSKDDVNLIPKTAIFEVRSASGVGTTTKATLKLNDVTWSKVDSKGGISYAAHAVYTGSESYLKPATVRATAHYAGDITSNVRRYMITATYIPKAETLTPSPIVKEPAAPEQKPDYLPAILGASGGAVAAGAVVVIAAWYRRKAKLVEQTAAGSRMAKRLGIKKASGCRRVEIPASIDLTIYNHYALIPPRYLVKQGATLDIAQKGKVFYHGAAKGQVALYSTKEGA
jgi:hypothetical protein